MYKRIQRFIWVLICICKSTDSYVYMNPLHEIMNPLFNNECTLNVNTESTINCHCTTSLSHLNPVVKCHSATESQDQTAFMKAVWITAFRKRRLRLSQGGHYLGILIKHASHHEIILRVLRCSCEQFWGRVVLSYRIPRWNESATERAAPLHPDAVFLLASLSRARKRFVNLERNRQQHAATRGNTLQRTDLASACAVRTPCITLGGATGATPCNALQHPATHVIHCNTLQRTTAATHNATHTLFLHDLLPAPRPLDLFCTRSRISLSHTLSLSLFLSLSLALSLSLSCPQQTTRIHMYMHVHKHMCIYASTCVWMHTHIHMEIHMCIHVYVYTYTITHGIYFLRRSVCIYCDMYDDNDTFLRICIYVQIYIYTYIYIYIYTYIYLYIYRYIYIIYTYMYVCIHYIIHVLHHTCLI